MCKNVELNRVVFVSFGVGGAAKSRQGRGWKIVVENSAGDENWQNFGVFDIGSNVFETKRNSAGHFVNVRAGGVVEGVGQIVAERKVVFERNRQELGIDDDILFVYG